MAKWLSQGVTIRDLVWFLLLIVGFVYGYAELGKDVELNTKFRENNTYKEGAKIFVTRVEYEAYKKDVIDRIYEEIKNINNKLDAME